MTAPLVEVRCGIDSCGHLLARIYDAPDGRLLIEQSWRQKVESLDPPVIGKGRWATQSKTISVGDPRALPPPTPLLPVSLLCDDHPWAILRLNLRDIESLLAGPGPSTFILDELPPT